MTTNRNLALAGAALLVVGLFCPIVTLPFFGNVNLFNDGMNFIALALLALALVSGAMALNGREKDDVWPGACAALILAYHFATLQFRLSQMRQSTTELEGNPFGGLAKAAVGSIQLQWGWLILALGVGMLVYAGVKARREEELPALSTPDGPARTVAGASILLTVVLIGWTLYGQFVAGSPVATAGGEQVNAGGAEDLPGTSASGPSAEEAAYIRQNVRLYDFDAKYYDSLLDGRTPGVDFKIQNNGNRTLNRVTVRVVFHNAQGVAIGEEEYNPVMVVEGGFGDNKPLRPNYIWQNEPDQFYSAKSVPTEWAEGKATATVTDIEFAPPNANAN